jgi:MFS family permease
VTSSDESGRYLLLALSGANFVQIGIRLLLGALVPSLLVYFGTTKSRLGLALTGMWAIYALMQFPSGILADRFSERPLMLAGLLGTIAGTILVGLAPSLLFFGIAVMLLGAGSGLYYSPASSIISRTYADKGGALSVLTASAGLAGLVYPSLGSAIDIRAGWRVSVLLTLAVTIPLLLIAVRTVPSLTPANPDRSLRATLNPSRYRDILFRPGIAYTMLLAIMLSFVYNAYTSFFPTFLVEYRRLDQGMAGLAFGAVFAFSTLSQPVAGRLSDQRSRNFAIGSGVALAFTGLTVLLVVPARLGLLVGVGLLGVGSSWFGPLQARFMDRLEGPERGYGFGLVRTSYILISSLGSVVVGTVAEISGWGLGFGILAVLLASALLLIAGSRVYETE